MHEHQAPLQGMQKWPWGEKGTPVNKARVGVCVCVHEAARESSRSPLIKKDKAQTVFNTVLLSDMHLPNGKAMSAVLGFAPPVTALM